MAESVIFTRLASSNVLVQAHASPDSRFLILPVIDRNLIVGWIAYDCSEGVLLTPDRTEEMPDDYDDGVWKRLHQARDWVVRTYYRKQE